MGLLSYRSYWTHAILDVLLEHQAAKKGKKLISGATKLRDKLKCKKGEDASHTGPKSGKCENSSKNRTRPRKGKKYADK